MNYPLPPIIHTEVKNLLEQESGELFRLLEMLGSPLNVVIPAIMAENLRQFRRTLDEAGMVNGEVYFAAKANKADAFLATSAFTRTGVDVSSVYEFRAALGNGVTGGQISVSGPTKIPELLALAVLHGSRVGVDEPSEIDSLVHIASDLGVERPVRVYLRLASLRQVSRFGMTSDTVSAVILRLKQLEGQVQLEGFSFHVPGYDSKDRVQMIGLACEKLLESDRQGLGANRIDIGGGFRAAYADPATWTARKALDRSFMGNVKPHHSYPYAGEVSGPAQLKEILEQSKARLTETAADLGRPVALDIEPGRSAVDQAGMTVFRVRGIREIGGKSVVVVDGNSRELADSVFGEFLVDPVLLSAHRPKPESFEAVIASNTCKEDDYLARRLVPMPFKPAMGDLLVYVNSAGYQMDSRESTFHRLPLPTKVVATKRQGKWRFVSDKEFSLADCIAMEVGE
jgi:diaminopimelate decarboxylase